MQGRLREELFYLSNGLHFDAKLENITKIYATSGEVGPSYSYPRRCWCLELIFQAARSSPKNSIRSTTQCPSPSHDTQLVVRFIGIIMQREQG